MKASEIVSPHYLELNTDDPVQMALELCQEFLVNELPVLEGDVLIGVISKHVLLTSPPDTQMEALRPNLQQAVVQADQHFLDVLRVFANTNLTLLPVVNKEFSYQGSVTHTELVKSLSQHASINEQGAILEIIMAPNDYSLAQLAQIIEGNDVKILTSYLSPHPEKDLVEVTFKLNSVQIGGVLQTLSRYGIKVKKTYNYDLDVEDIQLRYEELIKYLNM